jgi:hypothetical protein
MPTSADRDYDRLAVLADPKRIWRRGDRIEAGEVVGVAVDNGEKVQVTIFGRVALIEYDIERDEVILLVENEL